MPTKAELEAELEKLRAELASAKEKIAEAAAPKEEASEEGLAEHLMHDGEALLKEFVKEIEDLSANRPVLTVVGAFCLGLLLARR
ncbi:hypothetical protein PSA7680_02754 [Pseudoruegeria aquimaris]|uniref:DUF883 domain-containing protein n=1 Tax=Pseudoruegeria aquimaris TaxID=393663 RepID=A0A1Y5T2R7_9RHOB|nr:hypothetical protein [Pseudoruegeria aquimaris]SLN52490.1 hypothetical protein PSA7680_02754 [Pseudoruegeria aquimaris]